MTEFSASTPFAALSVEQVSQLIKGIVFDGLSNLTPTEPTSEQSDILNIDGALQFLAELGYLTAKGSLYNLVSNCKIPYQKIGKRLIFSRSALTAWVAEKVETRETRSDAALNLAASANLKR